MLGAGKMKLIFKPIKNTFRVYNRKKIWLGIICYDDAWKCWVWVQEPNIQMSASCQEQVLNKTKELDKKRKSD